MPQRSRQLVARILFVVFALYYANICFFYHSHIINGATIVHSHFHSKDHTQTGSHSESQLTLISAIAAFQSLQAALFSIGLGVFLFLLATILPAFEKRAVRNFALCTTSRGPPFLS